MQRPAKPRTPVRFRPRPPVLQKPASAGFLLSAIWRRCGSCFAECVSTGCFLRAVFLGVSADGFAAREDFLDSIVRDMGSTRRSITASAAAPFSVRSYSPVPSQRLGGEPDGRCRDAIFRMAPGGLSPNLRPHVPHSSARWRAPTLRGRAYSNGTVEAPEGIP